MLDCRRGDRSAWASLTDNVVSEHCAQWERNDGKEIERTGFASFSSLLVRVAAGSSTIRSGHFVDGRRRMVDGPRNERGIAKVRLKKRRERRRWVRE